MGLSRAVRADPEDRTLGRPDHQARRHRHAGFNPQQPTRQSEHMRGDFPLRRIGDVARELTAASLDYLELGSEAVINPLK